MSSYDLLSLISVGDQLIQNMLKYLEKSEAGSSHRRKKRRKTYANRTNNMLLPYANVDSYLRSLASQAEGFGRFAIGGLHGKLYHVTTLSDDGLGSLRAGCREKEPLWIVFEVSGTIELSSCLNVSSYKTIDGRGQRIKLTGTGLRLKECEQVIVCNLEFEGGRGPDVDAIQIKPNSKNIWIDRCSLKDYDDGLINITGRSTNITISRCYFSNHDKAMLIGADPAPHGDRCMCVTIHHCFFDGTRQPHPHVRFAKVHLYNNYTRNWGIYAVCASVQSQIYSQCNIYKAGPVKVAFKYLTEKAGDKEEASTGCVTSEGDLFMSGTEPGLLEATTLSGSFHPSQHYQTWTVEPATKELQHILRHCTGWQAIPLPPGTTCRPPGKARKGKSHQSSGLSDASSSRNLNEEIRDQLASLAQVRRATLEFLTAAKRERAMYRDLSLLATPTDQTLPEDQRKVIEARKAKIVRDYEYLLSSSD